MGLLHFVGWRWIVLRSSGSHLKSFGKTILNRKARFWSTIAIATAGNLLIFVTSPAKWKHTFNSKRRGTFFLTSSSVNQNLLSSGNEDSIWLVSSSIHAEEIHMFVWDDGSLRERKKIQTELHSIKRLTSWHFLLLSPILRCAHT